MNASTSLITTVHIAQHAAGEGPVVDLTGAHQINYQHEKYRLAYPDTIRALGTARSSHGWSVAVGAHQSDPDNKGIWARMTVLVLDGPDRQRQVIHAPFFAHGTAVFLLAGDIPFDLTHLLRLPGDPNAYPVEDLPALIDSQWRRVERIHALTAGVIITGQERGLDAIAEWWQLPSCIPWAVFPDVESADEYWDDFQDANTAHGWFERGFSGREAVAWAKAVGTHAAVTLRRAQWTPDQAHALYEALDRAGRGSTSQEALAHRHLRNRWERAAAERTHTPDQFITAARAGLSLDEMQQTIDWASVTLMAALRDTTTPTAQIA